VDLVISAARVLVGLVFLAAVAGKARDVRGFAASVRDLPGLPSLSHLPRALAAPVVPGVLAAEAAVVVLLAFPATAAWGFALAVILAAGFLAVIIRVLRSGTTASCLCFGSTPREFGVRHVIRDVLLGAVALIGLAGTAGARQDGAGIAGPAWALCAAAGALGAVALVLLDEIVDLYAG
jgi:Methylamine utilisation protein MauE